MDIYDMFGGLALRGPFDPSRPSRWVDGSGVWTGKHRGMKMSAFIQRFIRDDGLRLTNTHWHWRKRHNPHPDDWSGEWKLKGKGVARGG